MTRKKSRARLLRKGLQPEYHCSTTSPSALKGKIDRRQEQHLPHLYPRRHADRNDLRDFLTAELGLPSDATILFRYKEVDAYKQSLRKILQISFGTVVVIDAIDLTLVLVFRANRFQEISEELRKKFNHAISTSYFNSEARIPNNKHTSVSLLERCKIYWGKMAVFGWRGASQTGKTMGIFSFNEFTSRKEFRILDDKQRMAEMHKIKDFLAERFASMSLSAYTSNAKKGEAARVPGFDEIEWKNTPNSDVFASAMVVTSNGFFNLPHADNDHTRYAFGLFALIERLTGVPHDKQGPINLGDVKGAKFIMKEYGIEVNFELCDGTVELVWDTKVEHYTCESQTLDREGRPVNPAHSLVTRFGSSLQISKDLVLRIRLLNLAKETMSEDEWASFLKLRVKTYKDECDFKLERSETNQG